jgi:hypothetical protein
MQVLKVLRKPRQWRGCDNQRTQGETLKSHYLGLTLGVRGG